MRVGIGYDIHCLVKGRRLILGGVEIPFEKGLIGHSDADVLLHAVMDAILGAAALGDIGQHFSNTDPKYKDASSLNLLQEAVKLIKPLQVTPSHSLPPRGGGVGRGGARSNIISLKISNIDAVIIAESPKLAPYVQQMRENIAEACGIEVGSVSIKATTNEAVGAVGRGEAIAAQAVALLVE